MPLRIKSAGAPARRAISRPNTDHCTAQCCEIMKSGGACLLEEFRSLSTVYRHNVSRPPSCRCDVGDLLKRAINLIDPPLYSADNSSASEAAKSSELNGGNVFSGQNPICNEIDSKEALDQSNDDIRASMKKKKVQFDESSFNERKKISVQDAIRAHEYLLHAITINSRHLFEEIHPTSIGWNKLQQLADSYRALLVTCNLLLEMLDVGHDIDANQESFDGQWQKYGTSCPTLTAKSSETQCLTPAMTYHLLSSSRRCILSLKYTERLCAAKTISERHTKSPKSFYIGGDDIEDYDRCTNDLHIDYDWHDDGFLPEPALYSDHATNYNQDTSLLHECCYRPRNSSVQPSSRYEKSASTKELVRGERLISMSLDEYECQDSGDSYNFAVEKHTSEQVNGNDSSTNDSNAGIASGSDRSNYRDVSKHNSNRPIESSRQVEEDSPFFTLSPSALAKEEEHLLNIMVSYNQTDSMKASLSKPKKKKRKLKHSQMNMLQPYSNALYNSHTNMSNFDWKEGYLLLGLNDYALPLTRKVYAKVRFSPFVHFTTLRQYFQLWYQYEASSVGLVIN